MVRDDFYETQWVELYDLLMPERKYRKGAPILIKAIRRYCPNAKNILELACGTGRYTKYFVNAGYNIKGTDLSAAAIKRAKKHVPEAKFSVADMTKFKEAKKYDVVACLFEAFRYCKTYKDAQIALNKIANVLNQDGIFICDFGIFPPTKKKITVTINEDVKYRGKMVGHDMILWTEGKYDMREGVMRITEDGKTTIKNIHREPFLRIDKNRMYTMMRKAGLQPLETRKGFIDDKPNTYLSIAKKAS